MHIGGLEIAEETSIAPHPRGTRRTPERAIAKGLPVDLAMADVRNASTKPVPRRRQNQDLCLMRAGWNEGIIDVGLHEGSVRTEAGFTARIETSVVGSRLPL